MRRLLPSAACLLLAAPALRAQSSASTPVGVFMEFESKPGAAALETMEREVGVLLKPSGITLDWRLARENRGNKSFAGLVLLKFKGSCRAEPATRPVNDFGSLGETRTLGATKVTHGHVLPYTEVLCDEVREALSYLGPGADRHDRQKALGIALARVVAHELYHVLARSTSHAAEGLAKATQSLEDLVSPKGLDFRAEDSRAIGRGVGR